MNPNNECKMKKPYAILMLLLLFLLGGCEIKTRSDSDKDRNDRYYAPDRFPAHAADLHTLLGSFDIRDQYTHQPIRDAQISVWIREGHEILDAFTVLSGPQGGAGFEINVRSWNRPYTRLDFEVRKAGFSTISGSAPIGQTATFPDGRGGHQILYEAGAVIYMSPDQ